MSGGKKKVYVHVRIDEELAKIVRKVLEARRGAISEFFEEAVKEKLERDYGIKLK